MVEAAQTAAFGDTVMFVSKDRNTYIRVLEPGGQFQTHYGVVRYDDVAGQPYGARLQTHLGKDLWLLTPSTDDLVRHLRRESQIIYPKDLGYILIKLGVRPGATVVEAGTGSGALTLALAMTVGETGHVYSYDRRADMQHIAQANLAAAGLAGQVTWIQRDILDGFDAHNADALFLDLPNPWDYLEQARAALRGGGFFGSIVPTINQVEALTEALYRGPWFMVEIEELLLRGYKTIPQRIRPDEQMVGHTGYLLFARALVEPTSPVASREGKENIVPD